MSFLTNLIAAVTSVVPTGLVFHPEFKVTKVAEGTFDISWSAAGKTISGVNHASLVIQGGKFTFTGDIAIIGQDSIFPLNVIAQVINGALQAALGGSPTPLKALKASKVLPLKSAESINEVVAGPVGGFVVVKAVEAPYSGDDKTDVRYWVDPVNNDGA